MPGALIGDYTVVWATVPRYYATRYRHTRYTFYSCAYRIYCCACRRLLIVFVERVPRLITLRCVVPFVVRCIRATLDTHPYLIVRAGDTILYRTPVVTLITISSLCLN